MSEQKPIVGIVMGSDSDLATMGACAKMLEALGIPFEIRIASAHRSPEKSSSYAKTAEKRGLRVLVCAAGKAAHLAGVIAAETVLPVIAVPMQTSFGGGMDSLLSMVQMPRGIPVATMAVGETGAHNAALMAAAILAVEDKGLRERLREYRRSLADGVEEKDALLQDIGYVEYLARKPGGKGK